MQLQFCYKTGHYSKIYIGEYSAKFNTNISMLWLHKKRLTFQILGKNVHFFKKISISLYSATYQYLKVMIAKRWLQLKFSYKTAQYSNKIYVIDYIAKFNTNISMLWLHKKRLTFQILGKNLHFFKKISIRVYFATFSTNI